MDGKTEVQRETGHGQNLNPDNLTAESRFLVTILQISSSLPTADFNSSSLRLCVKGGRREVQKVPTARYVHSIPHPQTDIRICRPYRQFVTVCRAAEVLRSLLTPPTLNLFLL